LLGTWNRPFEVNERLGGAGCGVIGRMNAVPSTDSTKQAGPAQT
jgi:hypothetical protein